jgi:fructose-1,6-bisphosphatase II / sedoheptulose-1,7-bisphosphatase
MIHKDFLDKFIYSTEMAAYGAAPFIGKNDKNAADGGAVDQMRSALNDIDFNGKIVIGEGEMDEAPMLYIGEQVGKQNGPELDIAVDPLEGTKFTARGLGNAFSVLAVAEKGNLLSAPDTYMDKIVVGSNLPKNLLDLDNSIEENIEIIAGEKNKKINELNVCLLKRLRHSKIISSLEKMSVKINFITDGDIAGALSVIGENPMNDVYLGSGGAPEGVVTAAALTCLGGQIQGRLLIDSADEARAKKLGIMDLKKKYNTEDMVSGDVIFCATGVTDGDLVKGIVIQEKSFVTNTFALHKSQNINIKITNTHKK